MLASILPGIRQVRTPLVTGYLWFLLAWLILGQERLIPDEGSDGIPGKLEDLSSLAGRATTLAAISLAAYLIGSMLVISKWPRGFIPHPKEPQRAYQMPWLADGKQWSERVARKLRPSLTYVDVNHDEDLNVLSRSLEDVRENVTDVLHDDSGNPIRFPPPAQSGAIERKAMSLALLITTLKEIDHVAARLQIDKDSLSLYQEYDRLKNEAELRYSIVPPLSLVIGVVALTWHDWVAVGFMLPMALVVQGRRVEKRSIERVLTALELGVVESPTATVLISKYGVGTPL